jgi:hypothetical protein
VEKGETLINCLAYIDLNPLRAGLVERPEEYRWNSLGYHVQTGNKDNFLSLDFGLIEFGVLKEFVSINYQRFKDIFMSKREKIPKAVTGLDGVYSLKRLSEIV